MLNNLLKKVFGSRNDRLIKQYFQSVATINALESKIAALTDAELRAKTDEFKQRIDAGQPSTLFCRKRSRSCARPANVFSVCAISTCS